MCAPSRRMPQRVLPVGIRETHDHDGGQIMGGDTVCDCAQCLSQWSIAAEKGAGGRGGERVEEGFKDAAMGCGVRLGRRRFPQLHPRPLRRALTTSSTCSSALRSCPSRYALSEETNCTCSNDLTTIIDTPALSLCLTRTHRR